MAPTFSRVGASGNPGAVQIENKFGRLKEWRRIHTRYDRCAHTFVSAIFLAAVVIFWI